MAESEGSLLSTGSVMIPDMTCPTAVVLVVPPALYHSLPFLMARNHEAGLLDTLILNPAREA